jgi:hypothetical protein
MYNRFKNTIILLSPVNGGFRKIIITDKELKLGKVTSDGKKKIKPITISKDEIYQGKWRRWIIKKELMTGNNETISDREIEEYLNNEDLIKLYLAGKFKETLIFLLGAIIVLLIIGFVINGYLISTKETVITQNNQTTQYIKNIVIDALRNYTNVPIQTPRG